MKIMTTATSSCDSTRGALEMNLFGLSLCFVTPMLGGFLYGFDIGATSFVLAMLSNPPTAPHGGASTPVWWANISSLQQGLFVSGLSLGALMGSHLVLTYLSHKIGRRMELRLAAILYMTGALFNVLSGTFLRHSVLGFFSLILGRILYGVGVSFVMHGAATYIAEQSPPEIRGAVVSAKETVIVGGIVLGYTVGNWMSTDPLHWTDLYGVCGLMALPMFLLSFCIPRSKRWLLLHGFDEEAYESMKFVYKGDIQEEFEELVEKVLAGNRAASPTMDDKTRQPSLMDPRYRKAMAASAGLIFFQQLSGQPSVLSYATVLFQAAGWSGNASVITSVLMMFTSMITVVLVERIGRKALLCACCIVMMISLSALTTTFWGWDDDVGVETGSTQKVVILCSMFFYIAGYQLGFGPISWTIISEVFPLEIRGKAVALCVEMNYALNFAVQFAFPLIQNSIGWGPSFSMFAMFLAFAFFYIRSFVPETTGLTLEEIQLLLHDDQSLGDKDIHLQDVNASESSHLLAPSSILGGAWNLEEMEDQLHRRQSGNLTPLIRHS